MPSRGEHRSGRWTHDRVRERGRHQPVRPLRPGSTTLPRLLPSHRAAGAIRAEHILLRPMPTPGLTAMTGEVVTHPPRLAVRGRPFALPSREEINNFNALSLRDEPPSKLARPSQSGVSTGVGQPAEALAIRTQLRSRRRPGLHLHSGLTSGAPHGPPGIPRLSERLLWRGIPGGRPSCSNPAPKNRRG